MKKIYIKGVCCKGCKKELENIFNNIYGVKNAQVSQDDCSITYEGFVSERVIKHALKDTDYEVEKFTEES